MKIVTSECGRFCISQTAEIVTKYTYDHMGRKLHTEQYIDNTGNRVVLVYYKIGQVMERRSAVRTTAHPS